MKTVPTLHVVSKAEVPDQLAELLLAEKPEDRAQARAHLDFAIGEFRAMRGLPPGERVAGEIMRMADMIDARKMRCERPAVVHHAADRHAAETDAVIAALAADQPRARALAAHAVIGERDLERGIGGLRARIAEEGIVEITGSHGGKSRGKLEHLGMAELEGRCEVKLGGLLALMSHTAKATTRLVSTFTTAGLLNVGLSLAEDILVLIIVLLSLLVPIVMLILLGFFLIVFGPGLLRVWSKRLRKS